MIETEVPIYLNWSFWAVFVSVVAIILSQTRPIREILKKAKVELDVYSKINITHKVGDPNLQLHIILLNSGGRSIRITELNATISRDNETITSLPAQSYLPNENNMGTLLFTTFSLKPNQEWGNFVNFFNYFNRDDEKKYQKIEGDLIESYYKLKDSHEAKESNSVPIELPQNLVESAITFYNTKNIWSSGEYTVTINLVTKDNIANISQTYRFTIFESHEEQLKTVTKHYKFGEGIWWNSTPIRSSITLPITEE